MVVIYINNVSCTIIILTDMAYPLLVFSLKASVMCFPFCFVKH